MMYGFFAKRTGPPSSSLLFWLPASSFLPSPATFPDPLPSPIARSRVRWVNENAFVFETQTRPCPTFGRPVHLGFPHRLRPGTSPQALRIPPRDGHPALRSTASGGFRSVLAVSSFRFPARLDLSIPSAFSGQRGCEPRFLDMAPLI